MKNLKSGDICEVEDCEGARWDYSIDCNEDRIVTLGWKPWARSKIWYITCESTGNSGYVDEKYFI